VIGKSKGLKPRVNPKPAVLSNKTKKIELTTDSLSERIGGPSGLQKIMKKEGVSAAKAKRSESQLVKWKIVQAQKQAFGEFVSLSASRLKRKGMSSDEAWAAAFKQRPKYSTKQKINPLWGMKLKYLQQNRG
jgi:hypothetical protein